MRGILICGGQSRRMGRKKQWLPFGDSTLLARTVAQLQQVCDEIVVVANEQEDIVRVREMGLTVCADLYPGQGPLAGLHAGLTGLAPEGIACLVGCDLPFFRADVVRDLAALLVQNAQLDAAVPVDEQHLYPVCAVYRGQVREVVEQCLVQDQNAMRPFLGQLHTEYVPVTNWRGCEPFPFFNMNTPDDYSEACALLQQQKNTDERRS